MNSYGNMTNSTTTNYSYRFDFFCNKMPAGAYTLAAVNVLCMVMGLPASILLLWVLIQKQRNSLFNNVYMLNLSLMDFLYNLSLIPTIINHHTWQSEWLAEICGVFYPFNFCGRPLLMCFICVDSYMAVVHPIMYMKVKQRGKHRQVLTVIAWVIALLSCNQQYSSSAGFMSMGLTIPVFVFCNTSVFCTLKKPDPSGHVGVHPQKQRALQVIVNSILLTIMSYPTLLIGYIALALSNNYQYNFCNVFLPSLIPCSLGSTIMPILYLSNLGMLNIWGFKCCKKCES